MSEQLLEALQARFASLGIDARREGAAIRAPDGLVIEPRVVPRDGVHGTAQAQVDFTVQTPRLDGSGMLDSHGGAGVTPVEAERNALGKFMQGSFPVIAAALTPQRAAEEVEWETWSGAAGARLEGFDEFFPRLAALFRQTQAPGPHWMRVFLGSLDGTHTGGEVLIDGAPWPAGIELLDSQSLRCPPGCASVRHLLIALPEDS